MAKVTNRMDVANYRKARRVATKSVLMVRSSKAATPVKREEASTTRAGDISGLETPAY
jgi:hypothetical protein